MTATFTVEADPFRSLLSIRLSGFFGEEDVTRLALERNDAVRRLRCRPNQHVTLCDARGGKLSTAAVAADFQRLLGDPSYASRRLAYIADGALARMQASRVLGRSDIGFFDAPAPALDWLLAA